MHFFAYICCHFVYSKLFLFQFKLYWWFSVSSENLSLGTGWPRLSSQKELLTKLITALTFYKLNLAWYLNIKQTFTIWLKLFYLYLKKAWSGFLRSEIQMVTHQPEDCTSQSNNLWPNCFTNWNNDHLSLTKFQVPPKALNSVKLSTKNW